MKKSLLLITLLFSLLIIPQYAFAGLSEGCFPAVTCPLGEDYYDGACNAHIETLADCPTVPSGYTKTFSCTTGCGQTLSYACSDRDVNIGTSACCDNGEVAVYNGSDWVCGDASGKWEGATDIYYNGGEVGIGTSNLTAGKSLTVGYADAMGGTHGSIRLNGSLTTSWLDLDGTNGITVRSGGSDRFSVNNMGDVVTGELDVNGNFNINSNWISSQGSGVLYLTPTSSMLETPLGIDGNLDVDGNIRVQGKTSCGKLYTSAFGDILCGTDATGTSPWSSSSSDVYWTGSGQVGIGTSSPSGAKLDVHASSEGAATIGHSTNSATDYYAVALGYDADATGYASLAAGYDAQVSGDYGIALGQYVTAGSSSATGAVAIGVGGSSTSRTMATGYHSTAIGYSTIATGNTAIAIGQSARADGDYSVALGNLVDADGDHTFAIGYDSEVDGNGSMSIGSNNRVYSGSDNSIALGNDVYVLGDNVLAIGLDWNPSGTWYTSTSNVMTVMGGDVGINTTSPDYLFHVNGDMYTNGLYLDGYMYDKDNISYYVNPGATSVLSTLYTRQNITMGDGSTSTTLHIKGDMNDNDASAHLKLTEGDDYGFRMSYFGGANRFDLRSDPDGDGNYDQQAMSILRGNTYVGIGDYSPDAKLDVEGTIYYNGLSSESDIRLKKNIKDMSGALGKIKQLRPVEYEWKDSEKYDNGIQYGLIAQELEEVFPALVGEDGEYKTVSYIELVAPLIQAIKEQQEIIEGLTDRIEDLENNK